MSAHKRSTATATANRPQGVTKDEIVELFIHLKAYAGAARAFDSYQVALEVFAETAENK
jgi:alkylhydroperoxidase/carboxymuconolactone decarboxylase family protein YurZ